MNEFPVMEMFDTIQGEGAYTGQAAFFIRLAGCDVGCVWCDVKESWDAGKHTSYSLNYINEQILKSKAKIVVITGGEPTMYALQELVNVIHSANKRAHIETSGVYEITGDFDWITLSPKKFKPCLDKNYALANELKVIVCNKHDLEWAVSQAINTEVNCIKYLQAEWDKRAKSYSLIADFVLNNPDWRISVQTHKYLGLP